MGLGDLVVTVRDLSSSMARNWNNKGVFGKRSIEFGV